MAAEPMPSIDPEVVEPARVVTMAANTQTTAETTTKRRKTKLAKNGRKKKDILWWEKSLRTLRQHLAIVRVSYSRNYGVVLVLESIKNIFFLIIDIL